MDVSTVGLRTLREVAETGSFSAAAQRLGYTQSAVSRQAAALERAAGAALFERGHDGVRLTSAGLVLLGRARVALDALDAAAGELGGEPAATEQVRLGVYVSGGFDLLPQVLTRLAETDPLVRVTSREGTTPALVRALRSGSLDVAVLTSRPPHRSPDDEAPPLHTETIDEGELRLAVARTGRFAGRDAVHADELTDVDWIASPSPAGEPLLGVWPGLPGRPRVAHSVRDWLTKLRLVAAGHGVTTVGSHLAPSLVPDIALVRVEGVPPEVRRRIVARLPERTSPAVLAVCQAMVGAGRV
ncbi:LysR family transcriptional regulator [Isoptericola cucumis]|uniref:LysR family transcriptional regulator n=1 Tax=Isoptericola cucumis TaxID=1776856 RepID=A0ABQ2B235_9MICO|nr:LysR family transcriptional regulator [Isoptericola cucumis]GGI06050.1 LysR family transcriptional regulator [Isoptericola cucumis]